MTSHRVQDDAATLAPEPPVRKRLIANAVWSITGGALPLVAAIWAIPPLIERLGTEGFGLVSLIWAALGYFSLFDLGIGRALTKMVAERLAGGRRDEVAKIVGTAFAIPRGLGLSAAAVIVLFSPWLVQTLLVGENLYREALGFMLISAVGIPFAISTPAFVGILHAHGRFAAASSVQVCVGLSTYAARCWHYDSASL